VLRVAGIGGVALLAGCVTSTEAVGAPVAADDASFQVERSTITGLIGQTGAGKPTLFTLITGFYEEDSGRVSVNGVDVTDAEPHEVAEEGLIRTFQTPRKLEGMTVREAMLVGAQDQIGESFVSLFTRPGEVAYADDADGLLDDPGVSRLYLGGRRARSIAVFSRSTSRRECRRFRHRASRGVPA